MSRIWSRDHRLWEILWVSFRQNQRPHPRLVAGIHHYAFHPDTPQ
jgi:hypothetical protein